MPSDTEQPGEKGVAFLQFGQVEVSADEALLSRFPSSLRVTQTPSKVGKDSPFVARHQVPKLVGLPAEAALDVILIGSCHLRHSHRMYHDRSRLYSEKSLRFCDKGRKNIKVIEVNRIAVEAAGPLRHVLSPYFACLSWAAGLMLMAVRKAQGPSPQRFSEKMSDQLGSLEWARKEGTDSWL